MKTMLSQVKYFLNRGFNKLFGNFPKVSTLDKIQNSMLILILKWRAEAIKLIEAEKLKLKAQLRLNDFIRINSRLAVADLSVENANAQKRIKNRIRATAFADAILGFMAITVMLKVLLNVSIAWIPAMLIGGVVAYWLLIYAIEDRIDAMREESADKSANANRIFDKFANANRIFDKFAFILPLLFLPAANLFVVFTNPGNPVNILLTVFLVLALFLNLSTARHFQQYKLMKDTEKSLIVMKQLSTELNRCENVVNNQKEKSNQIADQIIVCAHDLKREYTSLNPKPVLSLSIDKQIFLNNQIYHEDVFPIPQIHLTKPSVDMAELSNIWISATSIELPQTEINGPILQELEHTVEESGNSESSNRQTPIAESPFGTNETKLIDDQPGDYDTMLDNINPNDKVL